MQQLRDLAHDYSPKNIYNVDESGLFYRMGPSKTYLSTYGDRRIVRGSALQRHKNHISLVFCTYADENHMLPIQYIEVPAEPMCFRDPRFRICAKSY